MNSKATIYKLSASLILITLCFSFLELSANERNKPHFKWGNTTVIPRISLSAFNDNNVFLVPSDKKSDSGIRNRISAGINSKMSFGLDLYMNAYFLDSRNFNYKSENFKGYGGYLSLTYHLGEMNQIKFSSLRSEKRDVISIDVNSKDIRTSQFFDVGHVFKGNRLNIYTKGNYYNLIYDKIENEVFNKQVLTGSLNAIYKMNRIAYKFNLKFIDEELEFNPIRDNNVYQVDAGVTYEWTSFLKSDFNIGWQTFEFENATADKIDHDTQKPIGKVGIYFKWLEYFTFNFKEEYINQTGSTNFTESWLLNELSIIYQPSYRWKYSLIVGYDVFRSEEEGGSFDYEQKRVMAKLQYSGIRYVEVTGDIEYIDVSSDAALNNYDRIKVGLSFVISW